MVLILDLNIGKSTTLITIKVTRAYCFFDNTAQSYKFDWDDGPMKKKCNRGFLDGFRIFSKVSGRECFQVDRMGLKKKNWIEPNFQVTGG